MDQPAEAPKKKVVRKSTGSSASTTATGDTIASAVTSEGPSVEEGPPPVQPLVLGLP